VHRACKFKALFKACGEGWNRTTDTDAFRHLALPTELPVQFVLLLDIQIKTKNRYKNKIYISYNIRTNVCISFKTKTPENQTLRSGDVHILFASCVQLVHNIITLLLCIVIKS
jgi:hypothetical protein